MKSTIRLLILIIVLLVTSACCQDKQTHTITLFVNTAEILDQNVNNFSNFGQKDGSSNEDYTVDANIGDTIIWRGVSTSSDEDIVNITSINHEGGKNIFDKNVLQGNEEDPEEVIGVVKYNSIDTRTNKKKYKYKIKFTVINNGEKRNGTFHIDPKIQVSK